jgi:hypothetical protein
LGGVVMQSSSHPSTMMLRVGRRDGGPSYRTAIAWWQTVMLVLGNAHRVSPWISARLPVLPLLPDLVGSFIFVSTFVLIGLCRASREETADTGLIDEFG